MSCSHKCYAEQDGETPRLLSVAELRAQTPCEKALSAAEERGYRRGYEHAANRAEESTRRGATADDLARWCNAVNKWRYSRKLGRMSMPPEPRA